MFGVDDAIVAATLSGGANMYASAEAARSAESAVTSNINYNTEEAQRNRIFNHDEAETARYYNQLEAQKARDFSEKMSSSAYQRSVADMRKAGINPMLSIMNGGASTPQGSQASSGAASGSPAHLPLSTAGAEMRGRAIRDAVASAAETQSLVSDAKKKGAETRLSEALTATQDLVQQRESASARGIRLDNKRKEIEMDAIRSGANLSKKKADIDSKPFMLWSDRLLGKIGAIFGAGNSAKSLMFN
ncbi:MAG: DNA pilot protein [Microvirus sp.]|nr:MAG: DNA pilot protein [Microvirus sp.]